MQGYASKVPATPGRTCLKDGKSSLAPDHTVWQALCDRDVPKKRLKDCSNNPLVPVTSTTADSLSLLRIMTLDVSSPTMLSPPPLKSSVGLPSRTKGLGRGTTMLSHQALARPSAAAAATVLACPASAFSGTNVPAFCMNHPFLYLRSRSETITYVCWYIYIYIYIYIYVCVCVCVSIYTYICLHMYNIKPEVNARLLLSFSLQKNKTKKNKQTNKQKNKKHTPTNKRTNKQ